MFRAKIANERRKGDLLLFGKSSFQSNLKRYWMRMQTIFCKETLNSPTGRDDNIFYNVAITDNNYVSTALLKTNVWKNRKSQSNPVARKCNMICNSIKKFNIYGAATNSVSSFKYLSHASNIYPLICLTIR